MSGLKVQLVVKRDCLLIAIENYLVAAGRFAIVGEMCYQQISKSFSPILLIHNDIFNVAGSSSTDFIFDDDTAVADDFVVGNAYNCIRIGTGSELFPAIFDIDCVHTTREFGQLFE